LECLQPLADIQIEPDNGSLVRIADIDVHRTEGPLCSLSFEFDRYGPHAYHVDCRAF
jgi:hypothetical protein